MATPFRGATRWRRRRDAFDRTGMLVVVLMVLVVVLVVVVIKSIFNLCCFF